MVDASQLLDVNKQLLVYDEQFILEFKNKPQDLSITFQSIQVFQIQKNPSRAQPKSQVNFVAIYGLIKLKEFTYLILVTKANIVGQIMQKQIFQAEKFDFYPLTSKKSRFSSSDAPYIEMLQVLFRTKTFYYSEDYDLTCNLQRQYKNPIQREVVYPYYINELVTVSFLRSQVQNYVPIFISGLVLIKYAKVNGIDIDLVLISRRDKRRMGRRFVVRGADLDGNCSNFCETEQIVAFQKSNDQFIYSFVQTRGSMPFKWKQKPDLKWSPKGQIIGTVEKNQEICRRHFEDACFSSQVLVNLIDRKGTQLMLGEYFQKMVTGLNNPKLSYVWFDFHHECRNMKYENLSKLIDSIKPQMTPFGQFSMSYQKSKLQQLNIMTRQTGVIRTNCMDCLDRTNVVQSVIGRHLLWTVLSSIGLQRTGTGAFEKFPDQLEKVFREMWAKNADVVSTLYTGTGALKTDFTKTGKRTKRGAIQDGRNSIVRYVLGNFSDADTQNSFDLLTGKISPSTRSFTPSGFSKFYIFTLLFIIIPIACHYLINYFVQGDILVYLGESHLEPSRLLQTKLTSLTVFVALISFLIMKTVVMSNHKSFVKAPVIDY